MTYRSRYYDRYVADLLDTLEPRCSVKGCHWVSVQEFSGPFGDRGFCRRHVTAWRTHYAILSRIRDILR